MTPLEHQMSIQIRAMKLPEPEREFKFLPDRKFRLDFAWPQTKVGLETNGQIWIKGGHSSGTGLLRDYEKLALANLNGWRLFYVAPEHVKSGAAIDWLLRALGYAT